MSKVQKSRKKDPHSGPVDDASNPEHQKSNSFLGFHSGWREEHHTREIHGFFGQRRGPTHGCGYKAERGALCSAVI